MKKCVLIVGLLFFCFCGCEALQDTTEAVADPNSGLNILINRIDALLPVVEGTAGVAAPVVPMAGIVALIASIAGNLLQVYKGHRTKVDKSNLEATTKVVLDVIDDVSKVIIDRSTNETIGDAVKGRVEAKLKDEELYKIAKVIISELKT